MKRELLNTLRIMQIELILENDKLKDKKREIQERERRLKHDSFIEFPYKRKEY